MKSLIAKLMVAVVIGAITNFGVAYWCSKTASPPWACRLPPPQSQLDSIVFPPGTALASPEITRRYVQKSNVLWGWPSAMRKVESWSDGGYRCTSYAATASDFWNGPSIHHLEAGWPFLCFEGAIGRGRGYAPNTPIAGIVQLGQWHPITPRWNQLTANIGIYALAVAAAYLTIVGSARLARRVMTRAPGLCATCGYDLRGAMHAVCPECGSSVESLVADQ